MSGRLVTILGILVWVRRRGYQCEGCLEFWREEGYDSLRQGDGGLGWGRSDDGKVLSLWALGPIP